MAETKAQTIDSNERNKSLSNPKANLDMTLPSSYFANNPYFFQGQNTTSSAQPNNLFILPNYKNSNKTQKPAQLELPDFISFSVNSLDWNKMKSHIPHTFDILQRGNLPSIVIKKNHVVLETIDYSEILAA